MPKDLDKVRYSHAGHDFHFLWTARRALGLLNPKNNLVAVSIEGISSEDDSSEEKGLLAIDTAEYYGAENIDDAKKIKYYQLKYSTVAPTKEWTASELSPRKEGRAKGTIVSFSKNFKENIDKYGKNFVLDKFEYHFVTNRPIRLTIKELLLLNEQNIDYDNLPVKVQSVYNRFFEDCNLVKDEFIVFLKLIKLDDVQDSRYMQTEKLATEVNKLIPKFNSDLAIKLKTLIHSRAMPEYSKDPVIRLETILHVFGIHSESQLLPAPSELEPIDNYVIREQQDDIIKQIIGSKTPIIIHASGGVGKSSFAQSLSRCMPEKSKTVIFDGFANGSYRSPKDQRHLHKNGLVQIINEFSFEGLCLPLLQVATSTDEYLKVFYSRLEEIVFEIKQVSSDALVLIVLDAADNSEMAAQEYDERTSFAKDLLQINPPDGCKIVALARSERLDLLNLPNNTLKIKLQDFSEQETKKFLITKFDDVDEGEVIEFYKLTFGNPRVQSYLLEHNNSLRDILKQLGHKGLSSDALIETQLEQSLMTLKEQSHSKDNIDLLCSTLGLLPPMVPIDILEKATSIDKSLILSFASDMGLALLIKDDNVQFRDEPVESWFRKNFKVEKSLYQTLYQKLIPISNENPYVAFTIPRLLYGAEEYEILYQNAYQNDLGIDDPVLKQDIILQNLNYAIKVAKKQNNLHNLTKLLLEASKVISARDRHSEFIFENADLISTLVGSEFINDFLYRSNISYENRILYAHSALMLSMEPTFKAEARSFLRLTMEYLIEWSKLSKNDRNFHDIADKDIAYISLAYLYVFDEKRAMYELNRWRSNSTKVSVIKIMVRHLLEHNELDKVDVLLNISKKYFHLLRAMVLELYEVGYKIPKEIVNLCIKILMKQKKSKQKKTDNYFVVVVSELSLYADIDRNIVIKLLEKYFVEVDTNLYSSYHDKYDRRDMFLRYVTLSNQLKGEQTVLEDFIPKDAEKKKEDYQATYGRLYPLYELRSRLLLDFVVTDKDAILEEMKSLMNTASSESWRYKSSYEHRDIPFIAAYICIEILSLLGEIKKYKIIADWLLDIDYYINDYVWIKLVKQTVLIDKDVALEFAQLAYETISSEKRTSHLSDNYAKLARAILPISKEDSKAYFDLALESNSTLGDDARYRMDTLCSMTNGVDENYQNPELAYKLLQVCEMVENFNGHKFSWYDVIKAISNIDVSSSLAIASRLKDRGTVGFHSTLSVVFNKFLKQKIISPKTYASIFILTQNDNWNLDKGIENIFDVTTNLADTQEAIEILIKDYYTEFDDSDDYYIQKIKKMLERNGITNPLLDDLSVVVKKHNGVRSLHSIKDSNKDEIAWDEIFLDYEYIEFKEIKETFNRYRKIVKYSDGSMFYEELRKRVKTHHRVQHLDAFSKYANVYTFFDEIEQYGKSWTNLAVKNHISLLIETFLQRHADSIISRYNFKNQLKICVKFSSKTEKELLSILIENTLNDVELYNFDTLLSLATMISNQLSSSDCIDVLEFGIGQFQDDLDSDESDGVWKDELIPPRNIDETIGAFIFTYLGSTRPDDRWRSMYAVRRLCSVDEADIIKSIMQQLETYNKQAFTDEKYEFYNMHAILYLFIALARGAKENPKILIPYSKVFSHYALEWFPHVLIRKYVADIALELEHFAKGTYTSEEIDKLKNINKSVHGIEKVTSQAKYKKQTLVEGKKKLKIGFGLDWEPYWFEPLSNAFGIYREEISSLVETWIIDKWGYSNDELYKDLRGKHKIYRENDTYHSHGTYPREDDFKFYLTYHAMFCAAGNLLDKFPIRYDEEYNENLWGEWFYRHTLTRHDGKWVSDGKDPMPMELYKDFIKDENWEFSVQHEDFDSCLMLNKENLKYLPVSAYWSINNETVIITSALVSSDKSHALLRALQTIKDPHDFYLAPYQDSRLVKDNEFSMQGWVIDNSSTDLRLDDFDPLAKISYPPRRPAPNIEKLYKLKSDNEQKKWTDDKENIAFIADVWGDHKEYSQYGERLQVSYDFLLELLRKIKKDLLVNVEIKREKRSIHEDKKVYYSPYFKLYLFKKDGTVHELYKHYKIR